ncbi:MAG: UDP-N-acetylmuramoyl-tripeptide--D-alanyl-D-alanine ligase [Ruminococcaceae bacterium]|nr:UDP-N-acetylmuramoyl-tripeptide--D-alanyl-D-alanine ligase [Oscillospiraceae bacterium]
MKPTTIKKLIEWSDAVSFGAEETALITDICTDSRKITPGCLFVALKGERFDGHAFLQQALDQGAKAVMGEIPFEGGPYLQVKDTSQALLDLASGYRKQFSIPVVGITGSVGKTTTKEMVAGVLSQAYCCLKTEGNFNNEIGVPLTLFRLEDCHEIAVIEMGMNHFGELSRLSRCACPDAVIINNIGMSHIENLGSREGILKAKLEILDGLKEKGTALFNGDDDYLNQANPDVKIIRYGSSETCAIRAEEIVSEQQLFSFVCKELPERVTIPVPGRHNISNAMAAVAAGVLFDVPGALIKQGIEQSQSVGMRMRTEEKDGIRVILDCYNANPDSMRAGISVLKESAGTRKIALLGDMLELGDYSDQAHFEIGQFASELDAVFTVGKASEQICKGAQVSIKQHFATNDELSRFLKTFLQEGDAVLIKGSRGMKMEEIWNRINEGWKN